MLKRIIICKIRKIEASKIKKMAMENGCVEIVYDDSTYSEEREVKTKVRFKDVEFVSGD